MEASSFASLPPSRTIQDLTETEALKLQLVLSQLREASMVYAAARIRGADSASDLSSLYCAARKLGDLLREFGLDAYWREEWVRPCP